MEKLHLISESIRNLQKDFTGLLFKPELFLRDVFFFLFVLFLFYVLYGIGKFINRLFFKNSYNSVLLPFVKFALGFTAVATSIFILGFASLLTDLNVLILLLLLFLISLIEFINHPEKIEIQSFVKSPNIVKILSFTFICIAFLRLIPPQTAGDPLDYHLRFPRVYLTAHSMMIPPLGDESFTTVPHLPEMLYIPTQIVSNGLMSHVVHYGFFLLIFFLLYNVNILYKKEKLLGPLSGLLFVSAPLILQLGTQAFSDFPALFCFLVACEVLLHSKISTKNIILSGILVGAALASKIWILYYFPSVILFVILIQRKGSSNKIIKNTILFAGASLGIVLPWYFRGYLLAGNPFYINVSQGRVTQTVSLVHSLRTNYTFSGFVEKFKFSFEYGAFLYVGLVLFVLFFKKTRKLYDSKFYWLILLLFFAAMVFPLTLGQGRYALPYMVLLYFPASIGLCYILKNAYSKFAVYLLFSILALYYLINTFIILPYGLGWANKDSYLRRNLLMDTSSYYDFNGQFTRNIQSNETVVNYGVYELYYADFKYKNAFYYVDQTTHIFLLPNAIQKLLIRGGDFGWFCHDVPIKNCSDYKALLITRDLNAKQYLYNIKYDRQK